MIYTNLVIIAVFIYATYIGYKRGLVVVGMELASLEIATTIALFTYGLVGPFFKSLGSIPLALGNVAAFVLIWVISEIACAIGFRIMLRRQPKPVLTPAVSQGGGAALSLAIAIGVTALSLVVFTSLPLTSSVKRSVSDATIPTLLLDSSGDLQWLVGQGIGRDIGTSLNFFTVTAQPESEERIELGYTTTGTVDAKDEDAMLALVNQERTSRGLKALTMNQKARVVARLYSTEMFARGYFSHISPDGKTPFDRMRAGGVQFGSAGENLALAPTLQLAHQGLMRSPGHRANILSPNYRTVGIGIIDGGPYGLMVTQDFTD